MDYCFTIFDSSSSDDELDIVLAFLLNKKGCVMKEAQHCALFLFNALGSSIVILWKGINAFS
jgi:hypothetical protein